MNYLGIDLGTTFSAVACMDTDGKPRTIPNREGDLSTPSVILFESPTEVVVGRQAKRAALAEPMKVAEDVKRFMGDEFYPRLLLGTRHSPPALSAMILRKLKQDAEEKLGPIGGAVITVPAYFDEARRQATASAAAIAGLEVLDILNEPTAAALAYAFEGILKGDREPASRAPGENAPGPRILVVYDLGGGTFDVTVLRALGRELTVLTTAGDVRLGGRDWDEMIFNHLADLFCRAHGDDPRDDPLSRQQLMQNAEELKKDLSSRQHASFVVNHAGKVLRGQLAREQFESMTQDLLFRTESRLVRVLRDAGIGWEKVDEVIAVGGSTRMPQVIAMLRRVTHKEPNCSLSPDEAVAHGAAIHAAICITNRATMSNAAKAPLLAPVQPLKAAPSPSAAAPSVPKPARPPVPAAKDNQEPDADPAEGITFLARLGNSLVQVLRSIRTTNVASHSLGVVVEDSKGRKRVSRIIARNSSLPASATKSYATVVENQRRVTVQVVEGESGVADDCIPVGTCNIESLPPGLPKKSPVEVTFHYDRSGRLRVHAFHVTSGAWAQTQIIRAGGSDPGKIKVDRLMLERLNIS